MHRWSFLPDGLRTSNVFDRTSTTHVRRVPLLCSSFSVIIPGAYSSFQLLAAFRRWPGYDLDDLQARGDFVWWWSRARHVCGVWGVGQCSLSLTCACNVCLKDVCGAATATRGWFWVLSLKSLLKVWVNRWGFQRCTEAESFVGMEGKRACGISSLCFCTFVRVELVVKKQKFYFGREGIECPVPLLFLLLLRFFVSYSVDRL